MDYVNSYDTTNGWQDAINAAIDDVKSTSIHGIRAWGDLGNTMAEIILPSKRMAIQSPIKIYTGITLKGQGVASQLVEDTGFTGEQLIEFTGIGNYVDDAKIKDLQLMTTTVRAIGCGLSTLDVVNSIIENITLYAVQGIILDEYTQGCIIKNIFSFGAVDTLLFLYGNANYVENIDKEGGSTGNSVGAYIYLVDLSEVGGSCNGNELHNILIEGGTSANKSGIIIREADEIIINNFWFEPNNSDGYMLRIEGCANIQIRGYYHTPTTIANKTKIDSTKMVTIDNFSIDADAYPLVNYLEKDELSTVVLKNFEYRGYATPFDLDKLNSGIIIENIYNKLLYTFPLTGYDHRLKFNNASGSNWLINGSFESGIYEWNYITTAPDTISIVMSEIDKGLMLKYRKITENGESGVYQNVTIPADFIGQKLTLSAFVKVESDSSVGYAFPFINGCGITYNNGYNKASTDSGWQIISQTFEPQSAGALQIGVGFYKVTLAYIDNINLSIGTDAIINSNKFGSIELNEKTITYASSVPTTGTWKLGDIVYNSNVEKGGYLGWTCTEAGTPGTWKQFGVIEPIFLNTSGDTTGLNWGDSYYTSDGFIKRKTSGSSFYAVDLDGSNEYTYNSTPTNLDLGDSSATVLAWVRYGNLTGLHTIFSYSDTQGYTIYSEDANLRLYVVGSGGTQTFALNGYTLQNNNWVLCALVIDAINDSLRLHIVDDRVLYSAVNASTVESIIPSGSLAIGASVGGSNFLQGQIGCLQIIKKKALTRAEIMDAYNRSHSQEQHFASSYSGGTIVAWYKWAGNDDANFLNDASASNNDLTGGNATQANDQVVINGGYKYTLGYSGKSASLIILNQTTDDTLSFKPMESRFYDSLSVYDIVDSICVGMFYKTDAEYEMITSPDTLTAGDHTVLFDVTNVPANAKTYLYFKYLGDSEAYLRSQIYWRE
ncbi:MAG: hypothetical protein B6D44_00150 [Ignavibacteriales bacterium UTCHB2]|jgi:hypothetical protein|nr:MAG: hypothetical protein B6D44_00150 [Ignavibacteriales bacterium UTCHB2]